MSMGINPRAAILYAFISKDSFMVAEYEALSAGSGDDEASGGTDNLEGRNAAHKAPLYVNGGQRGLPRDCSSLDLPSLAREVAQARQHESPHLVEKQLYHEKRGPYLFTFVTEKAVLFLCVNLASRGTELARAFLTELRVRCWSLWDTRKYIEGGGSSRQTLELTRLLRHMIEPSAPLAPPDRASAALSTITRAEETLQNVADVVKENIRKVMDRSEHIDTLVSKACNLSQDASAFHEASRTLRRRLWFASIRRSIVVSIVIICVCSVIALYIGCDIFAGDSDFALCDIFY